jgi:hypothetical protein
MTAPSRQALRDGAIEIMKFLNISDGLNEFTVEYRSKTYEIGIIKTGIIVVLDYLEITNEVGFKVPIHPSEVELPK